MIQAISYTEQLQIPQGYELTRLVATTYSLEPELVYLLMTLTEPIEEFFFWDDLALKKCVRAYADGERRMTIFYQEDKFYCQALGLQQEFARLMEVCCIPVRKEEYAFHPKIIFAEYRDENNSFLQKLVVTSRNLTRTDHVECSILLERKSDKAANISEQLKSFQEFINQSE